MSGTGLRTLEIRSRWIWAIHRGGDCAKLHPVFALGWQCRPRPVVLGLALLGAACARDGAGRSALVSPDPDGGVSLMPFACPGDSARLLAPPPPFVEADRVRRRPVPVVPVPGAALRPPGRVLLVSIDGLRPDALFAAPAPHLLALACRGAFSWRAQTVLPTVTLPSHASMVSGYPPEQHLLLHDDVRPGHITVPTVMGVAKAAGRRVAIVIGKEKLAQLAVPGTFDAYVSVPEGDDEVAAAAIREAAKGFDLMFLHFPWVDLTGHGEGWMSPAYLRQVTATDAALGRLLQWLTSDVTVLVTADHGGRGYIHWSDVPEDRHIPWIIAGPDIRAGHAIATPISTIDSAATAAAVLGLRLAGGASGRAVEEAFAR